MQRKHDGLDFENGVKKNRKGDLETLTPKILEGINNSNSKTNQQHWNEHIQDLNLPAEQSGRQTKTSSYDYIWTYLSGKHKQCDEEDK